MRDYVRVINFCIIIIIIIKSCCRVGWLCSRCTCTTSVVTDSHRGTLVRTCWSGHTASLRPREARWSSPTPLVVWSASSPPAPGTCCVSSAPKAITFSNCDCLSTVPSTRTVTKFSCRTIWTTASRYSTVGRRARLAQEAAIFVASDPVITNWFCTWTWFY